MAAKQVEARRQRRIEPKDERLAWILPYIEEIKTRAEELDDYAKRLLSWLTILANKIQSPNNHLIDFTHYLVNEFDNYAEWQRPETAAKLNEWMRHEQVEHWENSRMRNAKANLKETCVLEVDEINDIILRMPGNTDQYTENWKAVILELVWYYKSSLLGREFSDEPDKASIDLLLSSLKEMIFYIWTDRIDVDCTDYCAWCNSDIGFEGGHLDVCRNRAKLLSILGNRILEKNTGR